MNDVIEWQNDLKRNQGFELEIAHHTFKCNRKLFRVMN